MYINIYRRKHILDCTHSVNEMSKRLDIDLIFCKINNKFMKELLKITGVIFILNIRLSPGTPSIKL